MTTRSTNPRTPHQTWGMVPVHSAVLIAAWLLAGCHTDSTLRHTGGTTSTARGGEAGQSLVGGSGGTLGGGGVAGATSAVGAGGTTMAGGASAGGHAGSAVGGMALGGASASQAGGFALGGTSASQAGGSALGGATTSGGSGGSPPDADPGDGGIVASGFCEGDSAKLMYQGQTVTPAATNYESAIVMDCCQAYGVNLHATAWLGFDIAVELILSANIMAAGEYEVGSSFMARAAVRKSSDALTSAAGVNAQGQLRIVVGDASMNAPELGLCLEVSDATSALSGTKIYVPKVKVVSSSNQRFQIFLLKDSTLRTDSVGTQPLDSFVLTDSPLLDLSRIAYVERATTKIGFNPGQKIGDTLRTRLGTPLGTPFVVVADGVRIYLGTFTSRISSIGPVGPFVNVEDIASDDLTLRAPVRGTDLRNDARIIDALTATGKLVP
jgi:hypothetical protein